MDLKLEYFMGTFRTIWSMVGRTLVVDADGRQVIRPGGELGGLDWHGQRDDWEKLAPIMAGAPELFVAADRLADKLDGPSASIVDGRIVVEGDDVAQFLDIVDKIRAALPKPKSNQSDEDEDEPEAARATYGR